METISVYGTKVTSSDNRILSNNSCLNRLPVQLGEGILFAEDKDLALVSKVTFYKVLVYEACHDALHLIAR